MARAVLMTIALLLACVILTPLVLAVVGGVLNPAVMGLPADQWQGEPGALLSLKEFDYLWRQYRDWLVFSVQLAAASVVLCLAAAAPAGYALARHPFRGSRLLERLAMAPLSLPGIALSLGLIAAWGGLRGQWLVLGGHLLYTLPFMLRVILDAVRASDLARLEACARTLGAGPAARLRFIILPVLARPATLGALLVFAVSWGELNVSFLLNRGYPQTFPVALYNTYANESLARAGTATAMFLIVVLPALVALQWLSRGRVIVRQGA